jgi:hypothetical protein
MIDRNVGRNQIIFLTMETKTNDGLMPESVSKKFQSKLDLLKSKL